MLSGDVNLGGSGDTTGMADGIRGNLGDEAEAKRATFAILSGDIGKSGADFSAKSGYMPDVGGDAAAGANNLVTGFLATDDFSLFM